MKRPSSLATLASGSLRASTRLLVLIAATALLLSAPSPLRADDAAKKHALALELINLAGGGNMAKRMTEGMLASMAQAHPMMVRQMIESQPSLTPEQRARIEKQAGDFQRFSGKFSQRMSTVIDFDKVLAETYAPLYEKSFSEEELRQIVEFQRSPVGQKSVELMPALMQQGMLAMAPVIQPAVMKIASEILAEEQAAALAAEKGAKK